MTRPACSRWTLLRDVDTSDVVLTDGLRRQERNFARIHDGEAPRPSTDGDDGRRGAPARDYTLGDGRWETHAEILGARRRDRVLVACVRGHLGARSLPEYLPFAAFDGLTRHAVGVGPDRRLAALGRYRPRAPVGSIPSVVRGPRRHGVDDQAERLRVVTDSGPSRTSLPDPDSLSRSRCLRGWTSSLSVERTGLLEGPLAIAEVQIPGIDVDRTLVLPRVPADWGAPRLDPAVLDGGMARRVRARWTRTCAVAPTGPGPGRSRGRSTGRSGSVRAGPTRSRRWRRPSTATLSRGSSSATSW